MTYCTPRLWHNGTILGRIRSAVEDYRLNTPEAVDIVYDVAGIGTRFLAATLDALIWLVLLIVLVLGSLAIGVTGSIGQTVALVLFFSLFFILLWGYYIIFETLWSGQTPGKRLMKIRVIKTSGYPISFLDAVIRNLVRIADFLPSMYGIGVLTMFISPQARRLGDYAAGTIVVKERAPISLKDLEVTAARGRQPLPAAPLRGALHPDELQWNLRALTSQDREIIGAYLDRAPSLNLDARNRIGSDIASRLAGKIGARQPLDPIRFLERVTSLQDMEQLGPER
jgi:uncharacterized RDD family membrane protein YckC